MIPETTRKHSWSFVLDERVRILLADDDPILIEFAKVHLSTPLATIESATNGLEAWDRLCNEPFDLALIDIEMPGLDGFALVERIRSDERLRNLPVVMITAHDDIVSIDRCFQIGATSFVTKPVNWRLLSHQLRYVLRTSRMEADIRAARDRAEETSVLKSNILSVMRHEFRTPLNSIIGFSNLLKQETTGIGAAPLPVFDEYLHHINTAAHRLLDTFVDAFQYAQLIAGESALTEDDYQVSKLVEAALAAVASSAPATCISVTPSQKTSGLRLRCDRDQLVRALRHILENAVVHGKEPVRLDVVHAPNDDLVFSVTDQGPGIGADQMKLCAEPLGQAHLSLTRAKQGLGLGLPIARRVAELHEGTLSIDRDGGGTTVHIILPAGRVIRPRARPETVINGFKETGSPRGNGTVGSNTAA